MDQRHDATRRRFLKGAAVLGAGTLADRIAMAESQQSKSGTASGDQGVVPHRTLGRTGIQVSALGLGGYHLGSAKNQQEANEIVAAAMDAGVNFFDNAWDYHNGHSEEVLGTALKGKRDRVVVMTKVCTHGRGKEVAMRQLEESLRRLQTDHLDVWQIHEVIYENDPELIFAAGGAAEALLQAAREGEGNRVHRA